MVILKTYYNSKYLLQVDFVNEIKDIYEQSFTKFVTNLSSQEMNDRSKAIENAFMQLDKDMSDEALNQTSMMTMAVAMSGKMK